MRSAARWTRRRDIPLAILAWMALGVLALWGISHIAHSLLMLVIAALLAYAIAPAVRLLERFVPRLVAILLVYLVVLGGLSVLLYFVISTTVEQIVSLAHYVQQMLTPRPGGSVTPLEEILNRFGISASQLSDLRQQLFNQLQNIATSALPIVTGVFEGILDIIIVMVLSIYLLIDGEHAVRWLRRGVPTRQRARTRFFLDTVERVVGGYIRGQLLLSALVGVLVGLGMFILQVPYAVLLGVLAFLLEFVPVLGTLTSGAICVLIALSQGWLTAVLVLAYFIGVHIIEGDVIGPRIVGRAVGLHPVVSLFALLAGAELFGVIGAIFAAPLAGVLQALLVAVWQEWRSLNPEQFEEPPVPLPRPTSFPVRPVPAEQSVPTQASLREVGAVGASVPVPAETLADSSREKQGESDHGGVGNGPASAEVPPTLSTSEQPL
uniref:AI-2E family transporter n=1 Tax=Thermogemmatispora argillosa TaxID=2045280 RepID=A0A455T034_9CHLR|nr:AI-2E family transporter [Thermogemmatispora argillosa]